MIKSDKSKCVDKSTKPKNQSKSDGDQLTSSLANEENFISKVSQNSLNKVKKSSSFSSTTSLATSSSSDTAHINSTNKENDCELNNLISEFSDSFNALKGSYIIHPNVINGQIISNQTTSQAINSQAIGQNGLSNMPTKISLSPQHSLDTNFNSFVNSSANVLSNSPPKPPSRAKSTFKSNKQREESVNSPTVTNTHESTQGSVQNPVKCSTIKITSQPNHENGQRANQSSAGVNFSENGLSSFANPQTANKLTISVQASDKNDRRFSDMKSEHKSELILNGQANVEETASRFGLWSSVENDLDKSKRLKSVKQLKFSEVNAKNKPGDKSSFNGVEQQVVNGTSQKSNSTMELDLRLSMNRLKNSLLDKRELMEKQSRPERRSDRKTSDNKASDRKTPNSKASDKPRRSIDESVNKLASKSISRLADKSLGSRIPQVVPSGAVRNKSCSSLYQSEDSSSSLKKSRIPLSKSSINLGIGYRRPIDRMTMSSPVCRTSPVLTDNCLEVPSSSSSSFCSLCSSMSDDSLDKPNKAPAPDYSSSLTSSLSNLNSSVDSSFENSRIRTSHSMSKISQRLESLMKPDARRTNNCPFRDGTRSLSNLTSYNLVGYTNRRLPKTNSNHFFQPIRELSRIDESLDDDQEQAKSRSLSKEDNKLDAGWLDYSKGSDDSDAGRTNQSTYSDTRTNLSSSLTFSPSDNLHGMDESTRSTNTSTNHASSFSTPVNTSANTSVNTSVNTHNISSPDNVSPASDRPINRPASPDHAALSSGVRPSLNQFKSSLINQLIDSNSHLKTNLGLDEPSGDPKDGELDDEAKSLNETQKNIFNSKKCLFAKNRSLMSKTDSCKSFELNEKIVDLEMQLTSHKQKFNESLNLIKLLSDHCNDLIDVFNSNYNCKLKEIGQLLQENQRLIKLNDEYKIEMMNLNETCDDLSNCLSRQLNQELNQQAYGQPPGKTGANQRLLEQYKELEEEYGKLKSAFDYSRESETRLTDELNNLKIKFQQNHELYERVKSKALEKVER